MLTKSGNLCEINTSCRNTVQKEYYNKREQINKILFKVQDRKACIRYFFYQIFISHPMIALQKL